MEAAAQAGNLDALRQLIEKDKKDHPVDPRYPYTDAMQRACEEAARSNQCAALNLLIDEGCWINLSVFVAAYGENNWDAIDILLTRGWDVNGDMGHGGSALL
jgi:hypothetical protein